jgi:hypothetical protein
MTDKRFSFAKLVVVMAVGLLVGAGLCGLDFTLAAHGIGKSTQEFGVGPLDGVSLVVMVLSTAGLGLSLVAWLLAAIFGGHGDEPQRLFEDKNDRDKLS